MLKDVGMQSSLLDVNVFKDPISIVEDESHSMVKRVGATSPFQI